MRCLSCSQYVIWRLVIMLVYTTLSIKWPLIIGEPDYVTTWVFSLGLDQCLVMSDWIRCIIECADRKPWPIGAYTNIQLSSRKGYWPLFSSVYSECWLWELCTLKKMLLKMCANMGFIGADVLVATFHKATTRLDTLEHQAHLSILAPTKDKVGST